MATDAYYWAMGEKVPLDADPHIVVDTRAAAQNGLWDGEVSTAADAHGVEIGKDLVLLPAEAVTSQVRDELDRSGCLAPVYRTEDALIVVLPEVRVQATDTTAADVRGAVQRIDATASVEESRPGRYVVKPSSGRGADALDMANRLTEEIQSHIAQARFVRITEQ